MGAVMTAWFLLFVSLHHGVLLAGPYAEMARCEQDKIIVETFSRVVPADLAPKCVERPASLAPEMP
jgi:hypothetical protein